MNGFRTSPIIDGEPNELVREIHTRMPVILPEKVFDAWLSGEAGKEILVPYPADEMTLWQIIPRVNSPKNDNPGILEQSWQLYEHVGQISDSDFCRMSQCYPGGQWISE